VVEAVVALLLGLLLVHLGLTTLRRLDRFQEHAGRRQDALVASRIAGTVLRGELARSDGTWRVSDDSVALRAFRGTGVVCAVGPGEDGLVVAYRGDRYGDPSKDSVELVTGDGSAFVLALRSVAPSSVVCPGAVAEEEIRAWRVDGAVPIDAVLARIFESGSYHLTGSALRYRIGAGGRQPLTPEVWRDAASGLVATDSLVMLQLAPLPGYGPGSSSFLGWVGR
jgi:hypothetical protein